MAVLSFLLPLFFIGFASGEILRIQLPNSISFGVIDFLIVFILLYWVFFVKKGNYFLKSSILIFIVVCLISSIANLNNFSSNQIIIGMLYLVRWTLYAGLYFVFADIGKKFDKKIDGYILLSGLLLIIFGFLQFLFYSDLKDRVYQGWDDHMHRLFSTFLDPNFAGTFFVLFFFYAYIIKSKYKSNKKITYLLNTTLIITFIAIVLTFSRSALLMLSIGTFTYCIIQKKYKLVIYLTGVLILVVIILSPRFYVVNNNLLRIPSFNQRIDSSHQALLIYKKNPIFGVGFNNYRYARERYIQKDWVPYPSHAGAGSDNSFAFLLATTGIGGLLAYTYIIYKMFRLSMKDIKKNVYAQVLFISLVGLIANSILLNSLFYSFIMIWIWMLAGLTQRSLRG